MILKKLQTGATTVIVTKKEYDEYISQGYTYIEDVEVAMNIDEAEEENVRFKLDGTSLYWKYESDFAWTLFTGGGGGGDTYKVKVDATGTADYLDLKVIAGNNVTVTKTGDKLVIASTASGGSGVTVYADLAAIKAVDTTAYTTVQTVQVTSLGLYKFQPASTLTGDDVNVITPTTGSSAGRWIKQSIKLNKVYDFYQLDEGKTGFIIENDGNGRYVFGGAGTTGAGQNLAIATCNELQGLGKVVKFSLSNTYYRPCFFVACNGSYTGKTTNFKAIEVQFQAPTVIKINKHVGNTVTQMKLINLQVVTTNSQIDNVGATVVIRHKGNRIEIILKDEYYGVVYLSDFYEDNDLLNMGDSYGFTNAWNAPSEISNLEIADFSGFKTNIVFGGDSQHSENYGVFGSGITSKFAKLALDYNVFVKNTAVVGRYFQGAIDNFATEVVPLYNATAANNVYSIHLGTNDVRDASSLTNTATAMLTRLNSLITLAKNAGFKVNVCTVPVYNLTAAQKAELTAFNNGIRNLKATGIIDYIVDLFDDNYGIVDEATGTLYRRYVLPDNLHYTTTCKNKIAYAIFSVLSPVFTKYLSGIGSGITNPIGLTLWQMAKVQALDATFTATQNTKLNAINTVGNAVASGATITVPANKTIFHVTGTTAISTINLPYTGFTGKITIIPDGVFTFDISGNIAETYTATVNRAIDLVYDGTKWYRSNN